VSFDGVTLAVEVAVSDPEVTPGGGKLRIDPYGSAECLDGVIIALEFGETIPMLFQAPG